MASESTLFDCSTRRRRPCCPRAPGCSCCSHPSAPPARPRTHPARSSPPGRSPGSRRSRTDPGPRPARARSGSAPSASESTLFDCFTVPPSPLLSTRTGAFLLLAPDCSAGRAGPWRPARLLASWPIAWMPSRVAATVPALATLILIRVLLGQIQVGSGRVRIDAVRLVDSAAVTLAVHAHRGVLVARPGLERERQGCCVLLVLRLLADRLRCRRAGLILIRVLLQRVQVRRRRRRVDAVRLADAAAVALAVNTHGRVGVAAGRATALVAAAGLGCKRSSRRVLIVLRLLADRLDAVGRAAVALPSCCPDPGRRPAWSG